MLDHLEPRRVTIGDRRAKLYLGRGPLALEVVVVTLDGRPRIADLRAMFRARGGRRAAPVLIVAPWGAERAAVCGPTEHNRVEHRDLPVEQVEAVCGKALEADGRHTAIRLLVRLLPALDTPIAGLRNSGLFAMQELERGVPSRGDWALAIEEAHGVRTLRGRALIEGLGFATEELPGPAMLLLAGDRKTAVAVLLDRPEEIDSASPTFDGVSPVSYALAQADRESLDWVVAVVGGTLRLYPAKPGIGTGRRGRSETFVEFDLDLLSGDDAGYLWLLLSAAALSDGGSVGEILRASEDYAADLGGRLRERVYREVMPLLARAVVGAMYAESRPVADDLQQAYQAALRILYRLLFVAYAEDRDLLPLHASQSYREHSLKRIAQRLGRSPAQGRRVRRTAVVLVRGHADLDGGEPRKPGVGGPGVQRHAVRLRGVDLEPGSPDCGSLAPGPRVRAWPSPRCFSTGRRKEPKARWTSGRSASASSERSTRVCWRANSRSPRRT